MKVKVSDVKNEISSVRKELQKMHEDDFVLMRKQLLDYVEQEFRIWTHAYGYNGGDSDNGGIVVGFFLDVRDVLTSSNKNIFDRVDFLRLIGRIR